MLAEAACVELAALMLVRRPFAFATVSGVLIGSVGFAAEYGWTQIAMPLPWTEALLPEGPILAIATAIAGGLLGAMIALALRGELPPRPVARAVPAVALVALMALVANGLVTSEPSGSAAVSLRNAGGDSGREVEATVRLRPRTLADDAHWLQVTAWQGDGLVVNRLEEVRPGTYRTTEPIPVNSEWKAILRLHEGRSIGGVPIYLPEDSAIPAPKVPALPRFTRPFVSDKLILQREQKQDVAGWIKTAAPLVVLAIALSLFAMLAAGLGRLGRDGRPPSRPRWDAPDLSGSTGVGQART